MPKGHYHLDPARRRDRAALAGRASHAPEAHIRALARATLTDAHKAALAALLAAALGEQPNGDAAAGTGAA
jgi:hypothetical protein